MPEKEVRSGSRKPEEEGRAATAAPRMIEKVGLVSVGEEG